jgi:hypothetical protein
MAANCQCCLCQPLKASQDMLGERCTERSREHFPKCSQTRPLRLGPSLASATAARRAKAASAARAGGGPQLWRAWATYARQPTLPAALALALLYCTVLSMVRAARARLSCSSCA